MKTIYLSGVVGWDITADGIREQIDLKSKEKLRVIVNSPGGYVDDAFEIYDLFTTYKGEIEFVIMAWAASAMSYIIMSGDKISAFKNSSWMSHSVQGIAVGDDDEMDRMSHIIKSENNIIAEAYLPRLGGTKEEMLKKMKNEIWAIGWEQLTELGLIDNVIDNPEEIEIPNIDGEEKEEIIKLVSENISSDSLSAKVRTKIMAVRNMVQKDEERMKTSLKKAAAFLKIDDKQNNNELNPTNQSVENNTSTEDKKMTLQEFLDSNPEAQAENEIVLNSARDEVRTEMTNQLNADRQRLAKVLELEGVNLSEAAISAIEGESTVENYMEAKIKEQRENRDNSDSKKNSPFSKLVNKQTPKDQDTTQDIQSDEDFDKETENIAKKFFPGGKK